MSIHFLHRLRQSSRALPPSLFLAGALALLPAKMAATGVVDDFENSSSISTWSFYNGGEFPGARGAMVSTSSLGTKCAELQYNFTQIAGNTGTFDPHYVMVTHAVTSAQGASAACVRFKLQVSNSNIQVYIRVVDSSGQTLQYSTSSRYPLTTLSTQAWLEATADLSKPLYYWSGSNDGKVHLPITKLSVILDATGQRNTGYIRFDDISFAAAPASGQTLAMSGGTTVAPVADLGTLAAKTGVNVHFTTDTKAMNLISAAGMRWIRMDTCWSAIETSAGTYNFTAFDALVSAAAAKGIGVLAILDYGNPLYTGGAMSPPKTSAAISAFAAFCAACSSHYANSNVVFEIWNEPDVAGFWGGTANATEYAAVLRAGIDAVKRGNPQATVLTGGLSTPYNVTYAYWDTLASLGAMTGAGGWGGHLYTDGAPEERWTDVLKIKDRNASVMPGKNLWCTEWGFSSTKLSTSSPQNGKEAAARNAQACKVARELLLGWWANLPLVIVYDIRDDGTDAANAEHNFGLVANDYTDKPAMVAVRTLLAFANNRKVVGLVNYPNAPEGSHVLRIDGSSDQLYIVWAEEGTPAFTLQIPATAAKVWSMSGQQLTPTTSGTNLVLTVSASSGLVYVQIPKDTTAPSVPANVTAAAASSSSVALSWTASSDASSSGVPASGVAGYAVYRNGSLCGTVKTTSFTDTGLSASTAYAYSVSAYDVAGNRSSQSAASTATTATAQ